MENFLQKVGNWLEYFAMGHQEPFYATKDNTIPPQWDRPPDVFPETGNLQKDKEIAKVLSVLGKMDV